MIDYVVTGANGFIGSHLVREILKNREHRVLALIRHSADLWRLKGIEGNLKIRFVHFEQEQSILEAMENYVPRAVFHLAWDGVINTYRNDIRQKNNLLVLQHLLQAAKKMGVRIFVGIGSQAEYGIKNHPISEDDLLNPTTLYGQEKVKACEYMRHFCEKENITAIWLRLFSSYGPMDQPQWLIPYVIQSLINHKEPLLTEGSQTWDYLYVEDVAAAIFLSSLIEERGVFNLGSGEPVTIAQVVQTIYKMLQLDIKIPFGSIPFRSDQVMWLQANMTKFFARHQWKPTIDLKEGVIKTIRYYKKSLSI